MLFDIYYFIFRIKRKLAFTPKFVIDYEEQPSPDIENDFHVSYSIGKVFT